MVVTAEVTRRDRIRVERVCHGLRELHIGDLVLLVDDSEWAGFRQDMADELELIVPEDAAEPAHIAATLDTGKATVAAVA